MNKKVKTKWLKALRSGRYKQTKAQLMNNDGYCCLGVCLITNKLMTKKAIDNHQVFEGAMLPSKIRINIGLTVKTQEKLVNMNDAEGKDFREIADWIEENI